MKSRATILMAGLLLPLAALAQEWKAYSYPDPGFSIEFPGVPVVQTSRFKNALGMSLPMTRYELRQDRNVYTLTVVNYSRTNADALTTIVETERGFGASGKISGSNGARVKRVFGRQFTLDGNDGSRSAIAIFFVDKHLYTVIGQALPPNPGDRSDDAIRFDQSLQFADDGGGWFGGLSGLFGGGGSSRASDRGSGNGAGDSSNTRSSNTSSSSSTGSGSGTNAPRPRPAPNQPADATCAGKSAGDTVQLETPNGPVAAICTLVARPIAAPSAAH